jgi:hypothetical protein
VWILFLLLHVWLTSSFLVPVLMLSRWAAHRRCLHWLVSTRRRWILLWSAAGVGLFALLLTRSVFSEFKFIDNLGALGTVADKLLVAIRITLPSYSWSYWVDVALTAALSGITFAILALLAWWLYETLQRAHEIGPAHRAGAASIASAWILAVANQIDLRRQFFCADCVEISGFPFKFLRTGEFVGHAFLWRGVAANVLVFFALAAILLLAWNLFSHGSSRINESVGPAQTPRY